MSERSCMQEGGRRRRGGGGPSSYNKKRGEPSAGQQEWARRKEGGAGGGEGRMAVELACNAPALLPPALGPRVTRPRKEGRRWCLGGADQVPSALSLCPRSGRYRLLLQTNPTYMGHCRPVFPFLHTQAVPFSGYARAGANGTRTWENPPRQRRLVS